MLPSIWIAGEVQPQLVRPHHASHAQTLHFRFRRGQQGHHQTNEGLMWEEAEELQERGECHHGQGKTRTLRKKIESQLFGTVNKQTFVSRLLTSPQGLMRRPLHNRTLIAPGGVPLLVYNQVLAIGNAFKSMSIPIYA